jgi:hypothetical protein
MDDNCIPKIFMGGLTESGMGALRRYDMVGIPKTDERLA